MLLRLILVSFPILAALGWVLFNISEPAKDQWRSMD
ncbi:photosystem II protein Y [Prochlorococcus sp. MIT 1341]|nr:photosystem II protein Y [Prochlorococcus sp. MIT 1341]